MRKFFVLLFVTIVFFGCKKGENGKKEVVLHNYSNKDVIKYLKGVDSELIIVNFWATYCSPCKKEMKDLERLSFEYDSDRLTVIGVSIDGEEKRAAVEKILSLLDIGYVNLYGVKPQFMGVDISGVPTTFILDNDLNMLEKIVGKRELDYFKGVIEKNLNVTGSISVKSDAIGGEYYTLDYSLEGNMPNYSLNISLAPKDGYYLNGEGYPQLEIRLKTSDNSLSIEDNILKTAGIERGGSKEWSVDIRSDSKLDSLTLEIRAIVCSDSTCNMVNREHLLSFLDADT